MKNFLKNLARNTSGLITKILNIKIYGNDITILELIVFVGGAWLIVTGIFGTIIVTTDPSGNGLIPGYIILIYAAFHLGRNVLAQLSTDYQEWKAQKEWERKYKDQQ